MTVPQHPIGPLRPSASRATICTQAPSRRYARGRWRTVTILCRASWE